MPVVPQSIPIPPNTFPLHSSSSAREAQERRRRDLKAHGWARYRRVYVCVFWGAAAT